MSSGQCQEPIVAAVADRAVQIRGRRVVGVTEGDVGTQGDIAIEIPGGGSGGRHG